MASSRTACTSSGVISGSGLASAKMIGLAAILATISGLSTPAADRPRNTSAPSITSASVRAGGLLRVALLVRVHQLGAALRRPRPSRSVTQMFSRGRPSFSSRSRQASAAAPAPDDHELDLADVLADHLAAPLSSAGADDDRGAVLVVVEDRDLHALAQLALDVEAVGRLDVLEVDAAEGGLQRGDDVDQLVRVVLGDLDVEHVDAGELLEQDALAFHHRLGGQRADVAQAEHGGAVGDHGHQVAARGVARRASPGSRDDLLAGGGHAGRIGQRQVALVGQRLGRGDRDLAGSGRRW